MIVVWLFLMMPRVRLQFMIVVFSDHIHLLFFDAHVVWSWTAEWSAEHRIFIYIATCITHTMLSLNVTCIQTDRQKERQTDRQTERQKDR